MSAKNTSRIVEVTNPSARGDFLLVCEHASNWIPEALDNLGLSEAARHSHIAWDLGADAVSRLLSEQLESPLISARISRLVYDCNRARGAVDAMPTKSEIYEVPGNQDLSEDQRSQRCQDYYLPFEKTLAEYASNTTTDKALVDIHSFTPVYYGKQRTLEIGLIHDEDDRLANQMFELAPQFSNLTVALNQPYSMEDGTTHTINFHGTRNNLANLMIEIRNDLIETSEDQIRMAKILAEWLAASLAKLNGRIK